MNDLLRIKTRSVGSQAVSVQYNTFRRNTKADSPSTATGMIGVSFVGIQGACARTTVEGSMNMSGLMHPQLGRVDSRTGVTISRMNSNLLYEKDVADRFSAGIRGRIRNCRASARFPDALRECGGSGIRDLSEASES